MRPVVCKKCGGRIREERHISVGVSEEGGDIVDDDVIVIEDSFSLTPFLCGNVDECERRVMPGEIHTAIKAADPDDDKIPV